MDEISFSTISDLLSWGKTPKINLQFGNFSQDKDTALIEEIEKLPSYKRTILGVDIFHYSKMESYQQKILPFLIYELLTNTHFILTGAKYLFSRQSALDIIASRIDTGDGFFLVFETPIHAILFSTVFEAMMRLYNSFSLLPETRAITGNITYRLAMTTDDIYKTNFGSSNTNFYGKGIITCARILSKDKLNRFLIDENTYLWFLENIKGIENIPLITLREISKLPQFEDYDSQLIDVNNTIINDEDNFNRKDGIKSIDILKLFETDQKKDILNIYCIHIQATVKIGSKKQDLEQHVNISLGNLNIEGITF